MKYGEIFINLQTCLGIIKKYENEYDYIMNLKQKNEDL